MDDRVEATEAARAFRHERITSLTAEAWHMGARDPRRALTLSQEAYKLAREAGLEECPNEMLPILINLGRFHYELSQLDRAQAHLEEALTLALEHEPPEEAQGKPAYLHSLSRIYMGKGLVNWRLGDHAMALEHLFKSLELIRNTDNESYEGDVLSNIGMVYGVTGEYQAAKEVYKQTLWICENNDHAVGRGLALNNLAMVCAEAGEYDEALNHARRSLQIARQSEHSGLETNALDTVGIAYMGLGQFDEALAHFKSSASLAAELGDRHDELAAWMHLGQLFARKASTNGEETAKSAHLALQRALALAMELGDKEQIRNCHQELARLFKARGDYQRALDHYEKYHEADSAIYSERADMRFKTLQVIHETESARKEAEITRLRNVALEKEIEERRRVEAALRESETRFRLLMEESPIGVHIYGPDGALLYANRAWQNLWDVGEHFRPGNFNILNSRALNRLGLRDLVERAFNGEPVQLPEVELDPQEFGLKARGRDRGKRIFRAHAYCLMDDYEPVRESSLPDQVSSLKNVVLLIEDITEQRRSEEALRLAQKMESLGVLAGGVAHDFNNLLVAVLGQATLALNRLSSNEPARDHLQKVVNAAQQASDLTQQMLAYSGRGHFSIRRMNLNNLIKDHVELWQAAASHRVRLQLELASSLPPIEGDAGQLQQMILNLILNGAEARTSGDVTLRTGILETSDSLGNSDICEQSDVLRRYAQYTGRPLEPGAYVELEIIDEATGIPAEDLPHIFDPFFTTKEQGRGLGLAAVLGIVRGHKGGLIVRNNNHGGATFAILFPVAGVAPPDEDAQTKVGAHAATHDDAAPTDDDGETGQGTVLVIDDEDYVREAVSDILLLEDIAVLAAEDGYKGLDLYREHSADVDLVLLDLSMPGMDGEETYRRLRLIDPQVRVLLSSGYSASDLASQFEAEGALGFLQKPYSVTTLVDEVRRHLPQNRAEI